MKKILITGVFGSGKTTLVHLLKHELMKMGKRVKTVNEVARDCPYDLNKKQTVLSTSWLVMSQMENELKSSKGDYDFFIYDRGLPDIIAHTEYILKNNQDDLIFYNKLKQLGEASLFNFDYIFLSRKSDYYPIQTDDLRIDDIEYQIRLDEIHSRYLIETKIPYITLTDSNHDRLNQIISTLMQQ